jgi:hypothetical protein
MAGTGADRPLKVNDRCADGARFVSPREFPKRCGVPLVTLRHAITSSGVQPNVLDFSFGELVRHFGFFGVEHDYIFQFPTV